MTLLPMLAGVGLSPAFLDILRQDIRRTVRVLRIFNNETVYAESEIDV
jgi:hypothetical protein